MNVYQLEIKKNYFKRNTDYFKKKTPYFEPAFQTSNNTSEQQKFLTLINFQQSQINQQV